MSLIGSLRAVGQIQASYSWTRALLLSGLTNQCLGDHVDILGRSSLNDLILRVAGGKGHLIEENFVSNIREYADRVKIYEE